MRILAIETSCDESGLALLKASGGLKAPRLAIEKEVVASQIKIHAPWGGVVPNLAKREHEKNLPILYEKVFGKEEAKLWKKIDAIAVTVGPGLEPALWAGITFAKQLAKTWNKPLLGSNHMEGHLYSPLLEPRYSAPSAKLFPAVALVVSGGHTMLLHMKNIGQWKLLGETRDDAAGEAFDKVARLLNLPYPGGPEISRIAKLGNPVSIPFPQPMLHSKDYDFSFSGLKTAVLYHLKGLGYGVQGIAGSAKAEALSPIPYALAADIAASFEHAAVGVLAHKTFRAAEEYGARSIWLSGGVAANKLLRKTLTARGKKFGIPLIVADQKHNTDNAAMIGAAAYMQVLRKKKNPLVARGDMSI